LQREREITQSE
jgi:hypothetical protein